MTKDFAIQAIQDTLSKVNQKAGGAEYKDLSLFFAGAEFGLSLALSLIKLVDHGDSR